jgi:hypothetical protein
MLQSVSQLVINAEKPWISWLPARSGVGRVWSLSRTSLLGHGRYIGGAWMGRGTCMSCTSPARGH